MRYWVVILGIVGLACVAGSADAFTGCEYWGYVDIGSGSNPYMLYAIPDEYIPAIDGDLSDMAWMPEGMYFTRETVPYYFESTENTAKEDFDVIIYGPAWVPKTNSLYFGVHKTDDIFHAPYEEIKQCWQEDYQEWCTDPSGQGGNYREPHNCNTAQQNYYTPKQGGHLGHYGPQEYNWRFEPPYGFFAQSFDAATGSYDMEVMYKLWDWLDDSPAASTEHIFEAWQIIGLTFYVKDMDAETGDYAGVIWHCEDIWTDASLFTAFMVLPAAETNTLMERSTWGGIKAMFE